MPRLRRSANVWLTLAQALLLFGCHGTTLRVPRRVASLATGQSHACLLDAEGRVFCWGSSTRAELAGELAEELFAVPVAVASGSAELACGLNGCCVVREDREEVRCWRGRATAPYATAAFEAARASHLDRV